MTLDVVYWPHTFKHGTAPAGFRYCIGGQTPEGRRRCIDHGLVFGSLANLKEELSEAEMKNATLIPSTFPLPTFGNCAGGQKEFAYSMLPRRPRYGGTEIEARMYNAKIDRLTRLFPHFGFGSYRIE